MRIALPLLSLSTILCFSNQLQAQQSDRFAWAITDAQPGGSNWSFLRKLNLQTGEYSTVLLDGSNSTLAIYNASDKNPLKPRSTMPVLATRSTLLLAMEWRQWLLIKKQTGYTIRPCSSISSAILI